MVAVIYKERTELSIVRLNSVRLNMNVYWSLKRSSKRFGKMLTMAHTTM